MIIDSVIDHNINISKYSPLADSSYTKSPKELDHPKKDLINIQNIDENGSFKCCLVRYFHPVDHNLKRSTKADKYFAKELDFKDIKFPVKIGDIRKSKNKSYRYYHGKISNICIKKKLWRKTCPFIIDKRRRKKAICSCQRF